MMKTDTSIEEGADCSKLFVRYSKGVSRAGLGELVLQFWLQ